MNLIMPEHLEKLNQYQNELLNTKDNTEIKNILASLYHYVKVITPLYRGNKEGYCQIINLLETCEFAIPNNHYIMDSTPDFSYARSLTQKLNRFNNHEEILDYIVSQTRRKIVDHTFGIEQDKESILKSLDLADTCYKVSRRVKKICERIGVECEQIRIDPGFDRKAKLYEGYGFHYFNIIKLDQEFYLIDCSYRQFFLLRDNIIERLGIKDYISPYPGIYMMHDKMRMHTATQILKRGWIKLDQENMKHYLDGFALYYRNGLYYEHRGEAVYETQFKADDYARFLEGSDHQTKYEDPNTLGRQRRLLKDPEFKF